MAEYRVDGPQGFPDGGGRLEQSRRPRSLGGVRGGLLGRGDPFPWSSLPVEGIADYIEEDGRPISSYPRLDALRYYVRSGRWNGDLDRAAELFDGDLTQKNVGYALGYLTWRCIADRYGTAKMFEFAGHALFYNPADDAKADLGEAWVDVTRACANYIRAAVR